MTPASSLHDRMVTAFFDTRADADHASADLVAIGIPQSQISIVAGREGGTGTASTASSRDGFWASIKDMFAPDEDKHAYAEGLSRGGFLLNVHSDEASYDRIVELLDRDGAVDMDHRESEWRSSGWTGQAVGAPAMAVGSTAAGLTATSTAADTRSASALAPAAEPRTPAAVLGERASGSDETIALYEENLRVGKRDVNHGRVRLRSYVVTNAVHENVALRSENVEVDRRPVNRVLAPGEAVFEDRTIEAEEHAEEAVVSKEARVVGEVSLRKTASERNEQVNDSVRRTEVEVDDQRSGRGTLGGGTLGGGARATRLVGKEATAAITEHMDVIAADGTKVGTVDHLDTGERIKLAKDTSPDGQHHFIPLAWVDHVDQHVHLSKASADVRTGWN